MRRPGIVLATAMASHLTALGAGFVWLDHAHIEDGAALARPSAFLGLFTRGFAGTGYYRPLMAFSLSLDALVGGAFVMHLTSLVWHALAAVMTMLAGEALGLARRAALFAGILFAVHPLSALVADAIAFRSEAILTVALLGLVWAHVEKRPFLAGAAVAIGALTKESALVLGPLFVVVLSLRDRDRDRRVLLAEGAGFVAALVPRLVWAPAWRATQPPLAFGDAVGTRFAAVAKSAAAVLVPVDRSICDAFAVTHWWQPTSLAGGVALGALALLAWRHRGITLLLALSILPILQLLPVTRWWSPHYLYLPFAFGAMHVATYLERLEPRRWLVVTVGLGLLLGGLTLADGRRYESDLALWTPEAKHQPACREAQFYLGEVDRDAKRWDAAAAHYEAALAPRPDVLSFVDRGAALQNLGTVRFEQRRYGEAQRAYREALEGTRDEQRRRQLLYNIASAARAEAALRGSE